MNDPNIKLVALTGKAGTGKTLLALAAALGKLTDYKQILLPEAIFYCSARTAALSIVVAITAIVIVPAISGVVFSLIDTGLFRLVLDGAAL